MPLARMMHALEGRALGVLGQIKPRAEMVAQTVDNAHLRLDGGALHRHAQIVDKIVADGVALVGPVEADQRDVVLELVFDGSALGH